MKKIIVLVGSNGGALSQTKILCEKLIKAVEEKSAEAIEATIITSDKWRIQQCCSCHSCFQKGKCILDDTDNMKWIKEQLLEADLIIFGSPVYACAVSGSIKTLIDRLSYWLHVMPLIGKPAAVVSTTSNNSGNSALKYMSWALETMGASITVELNVFRDSGPLLLRDTLRIDKLLDLYAVELVEAMTGNLIVSEKQRQYFQIQNRSFRKKHQFALEYPEFRFGEEQIWEAQGYLPFDTIDDVIRDKCRKACKPKEKRLSWPVYFQSPAFLEATRKMMFTKGLESYFLSACNIKKGDTVLEVGCGTGYFSRYLLGAGIHFEVVGIDLESAFIEAGRELVKSEEKNMEFVQADACSLPFEAECFDVVISHTFFTSVENPSKSLEEMIRVCKKGGRICSMTAMEFKPVVTEEGHYPEVCTWVKRYKELYVKVQALYAQVVPMREYVNHLPSSKIPHFFFEKGLKNISLYPIGTISTLSNDAVCEKDKIEYIQLSYEAESEKFQRIISFHRSLEFLSEEEVKEYPELLLLRKNYLLETVAKNETFEWSGGASILVTGRVDGGMMDDRNI